MNLFKQAADIQTADQLKLPVPEAQTHTVVVQPSELQKEMVANLSERAALVHNGSVDPSQDNMLKITSDGRKIGLDQRLMNSLLPDGSKQQSEYMRPKYFADMERWRGKLFNSASIL